ncbi:MAG: DUF4159 domain-containing protein [Candidatus Latescibacteria bacterium]|nr:DUF4159 domain-containing protein [Candidatus Latescibacterota bacterium]
MSHWDHKNRRIVLGCLVLSLVLHLAGMAALKPQEEKLVADTLVARVQPFVPPLRLPVDAPPDRGPRRLQPHYMDAYPMPRFTAPESFVPLPAIEPEPLSLAQPALAERIFQAWSDGFLDGPAALAALDALALGDTLTGAELDLLRLEDMARADGERAAIILDFDDPRSIRGYINFTMMYLYGTGSYAAPSNAMADLARYMSDNTGILARIRPALAKQHFLAAELLKDPILFLLEGGGQLVNNYNYRTRFKGAELDRLGQYLRGGGFLYIEGSNPYLREMAAHLHRALGDEGKLVQLKRSHPVYHAYYDYFDGFPGEFKQPRILDIPVRSWDYPVRPIGGGDSYPAGLWGVEMEGELVALLSDVGLLRFWQPDQAPDEEGEMVHNVKGHRLAAATNIVFYALTRSRGLTSKRTQPLWARSTALSRLVSHQPLVH